jgi:hypothetical protein
MDPADHTDLMPFILQTPTSYDCTNCKKDHGVDTRSFSQLNVGKFSWSKFHSLHAEILPLSNVTYATALSQINKSMIGEP